MILTHINCETHVDKYTCTHMYDYVKYIFDIHLKTFMNAKFIDVSFKAVKYISCKNSANEFYMGQ